MSTQSAEREHYVEDMGVLFEETGLPPMVGRIMGWLLICAPPEQSAGDLSRALRASKGSISTGLRLLLQRGVIERIGMPGQRSKLYRIRPGTWQRLMNSRMATLTHYRKMAERGLRLVQAEPPEIRQRLEDFLDLYKFFEEQMPALLRRYERHLAGRMK